mmetsp:Transcript_19226/g.27036  ORF Transcript_19226/g.27036 Transcript_19226/m.27036 type:complete len:118 (+) Transcript_19226:1036-1389(+)
MQQLDLPPGLWSQPNPPQVPQEFEQQVLPSSAKIPPIVEQYLVVEDDSTTHGGSLVSHDLSAAMIADPQQLPKLVLSQPLAPQESPQNDAQQDGLVGSGCFIPLLQVGSAARADFKG